MLMEVTAEERDALEIRRREVTTEELATVLGLTDRRIRQLASAGVIERTGRGVYNLCDAVQGYLFYTTHGDKLRTVARSTDETESDTAFFDWLDSTIG